MQSVARKVELRDVAEGLWIWRMEHPKWKRDQSWEPIVTSTVVESKGERLVLDPLAPPESETDVWERLDARPPTAVVVLKPDHVRDVDLFVRRYRVPAMDRDSSFGTTYLRPGWNRSNRVAIFRED